MIVGSMMGIKEVGRLEVSQMDAILEVALDEIRTNPIIDEQLRKNSVIMGELSEVVSRSVKGGVRPGVKGERIGGKEEHPK